MKGRAAISNPVNRFSAQWIEPDPDGLPRLDPGTRVSTVRARSMLSENHSPDVPFELSVNPYAGCEHGCIYCYARPSHAYLDLSPGLDFETRIFARVNAAEILEQELRRPSYRCRVIAVGANTDAYQPVERRLGITRRLLELCAEFGQPVQLITKSALVQRDIDILADMAAVGQASVAVSLTSLDHQLKRSLEPRASGPHARLRTIEALSLAGVPVSVLVAPLIPRVNDQELERLLEAARDHGARSASYILLRLPHEVRDLFVEWLERHLPERAESVMSLLRSAGGGKDYNPAFGLRMRGTGPVARMLAQRFDVACRRLGLDRSGAVLDTSRFRPPPAAGDQLCLFG